MKNRDTYSIGDTNIAKCVAVVLLLTHHLFAGSLPAPIPAGSDPRRGAATLAKVCVAMFVFLSGYGLSVSFKKREERDPVKFTLGHTLGLMWPYWLAYVIFALGGVFLAYPEHMPEAVYGRGLHGALYALIEFLGLRPIFGTPTINQTWWYMEAALVLYITFPITYRAVKRLPAVALLVTFLPLGLYWALGNNVWDTCREIYWFFPFALGIFTAQRGLLDRFARLLNGKRRWAVTAASAGGVAACGLIRAIVGLPFDGIFAVAIILFLRATVSMIPGLSGVCRYIGGRSGDIFLIHSFIYYYYGVTARYFAAMLLGESRLISWLTLPLLLVLSLICAEVLALIRRFVTIKRPE